MWHEDLLAWQSYRERILWPPNPPGFGVVDLAEYDPTRVYLGISIPDGTYGWISIKEPTGKEQGIILGRPPQFEQSLAVDQFSAVYDAGTGNYTIGPLNGSIGGYQGGSGPYWIEFFHFKHGIIPQQSWYGWDDSFMPWYVLEVFMPNRPCPCPQPTWREKNGANGCKLPMRNFGPIFSRSGDNEYRNLGVKPATESTGNLRDFLEQINARLRSSSGTS